MYLADWRHPRGPGILPLQHHGRTRSIPLEARASLLAVRADGARGGLGHEFMEDYSEGDVTQAMFWPPSSRIMGAWSWLWTARVRGGAGTTTPTPIAAGDTPAPDLTPPAEPSVTPGSGAGAPTGWKPWTYEEVSRALFPWAGSLDITQASIVGQTLNFLNANPGARPGAPMWGVAAPGNFAPGAPGGGAGGAAGGGGGPLGFLNLGGPQFPGGGGGPVPLIGGGNPFGFIGVNPPFLFGNGMPGSGPFGLQVPPWQVGNPWVNDIQFNAQGQPVLKVNEAGQPLVPGWKIFGIGVDPLNIWRVSAPKGPRKKTWQARGHAKQRPDDQVGAWQDGVLAQQQLLQPMLPVRGTAWSEDSRFRALEARLPPGWPSIPKGMVGLAVMGSDEDRQVEYFHPTDPRLIAVHVGTPATAGSLVSDLTPGGAIDTSRQAFLQGLCRVIRRPRGWMPHFKKNEANWLGLVIGPTGQEDAHGGLVVDLPTRGRYKAGQVTLGALSIHDGGPLDVGGTRDAHRIGADADGNPIHPVHISTEALFLRYGGGLGDGPLLFENNPFPVPTDLSEPVWVHLDWHPGTLSWRWWTTTDFYTTPPHTPTHTAHPTGSDPDDPHPGPGPSPGPQGPGDDGRRQPDRNPNNWRKRMGQGLVQVPAAGGDTPQAGADTTLLCAMEATYPALSFRPQKVAKGEPDLRYDRRPPMKAKRAHDRTAPLTIRFEGYGAQGGRDEPPYMSPGSTGSKVATSGGSWRYTQPPARSRFYGGTASGGTVFMPPEVDLHSIDADFAPNKVPLSSTFLVGAPGARFAAARPELATGGVRKGWSWGVNGDGDLEWYYHDTSGAETLGATFTSDGFVLTDQPSGGIGLSDVPTPVAVTPAIAQLPGFPTAMASGGVQADVANNQLVIQHDGRYLVTAHVSFEGDPGADIYHFHVYVNGAPAFSGGWVVDPGAGHETVAFSETVALVAGDTVQVWAQTLGAPRTPVLLDTGLTATRVGN